MIQRFGGGFEGVRADPEKADSRSTGALLSANERLIALLSKGPSNPIKRAAAIAVNEQSAITIFVDF
jgi:hypothetical protein